MMGPCFVGNSRNSLPMAEDYPFRPCRIHHNSAESGWGEVLSPQRRSGCRWILQGRGIAGNPDSRQSLAIVPRHLFRGAGGQFPGVALQLDQVVEGVSSTQLAGVDQAHEQIADLRPIEGAIEQGVLSM